MDGRTYETSGWLETAPGDYCSETDGLSHSVAMKMVVCILLKVTSLEEEFGEIKIYFFLLFRFDGLKFVFFHFARFSRYS